MRIQPTRLQRSIFTLLLGRLATLNIVASFPILICFLIGVTRTAFARWSSVMLVPSFISLLATELHELHYHQALSVGTNESEVNNPC